MIVQAKGRLDLSVDGRQLSVAIRSYQDLRVWQLGMDLAVECYKLTAAFPREEVYGLTSQIRRSASSVPANIAEGYGREATGSYIHFLRIARGSLKELETHVLLATRVGIVTSEQTLAIVEQAASMGRMLNKLVRSLEDNSRTS